MKILVHDYAGHPFQVQLSRELAHRGHDVLHAYAGGLQTPRGDLKKRVSDRSNFEVREVPMSPDYAQFKYSFLKRRSMEVDYGQQMRKLIEEWKPEVVVSSNTPTESQTGVILGTRAVKGKFVYWCQDFYSVAVDKLLRKKIPVFGAMVGKYYKNIDRQHFGGSDHLIVITEDFKPIMTKEFGVLPDKVSVIPNWAPLHSLPVMSKDNAWAREQGLTDKFVLLYTGTLGMKHNPSLLSRAAEEFRDREDFRVVVISEGLGADWLAKQKEEKNLDNLILLDYQPFKRMPEVLATGDILTGVLENDAGIFSVPSKVLTYLCARRAILLAVPEVNLAARIIREHEAGMTVEPNHEEGYLSLLKGMLDEPSQLSSLGGQARNYAETFFDITAIGDQFEEIIQNLVS